MTGPATTEALVDLGSLRDTLARAIAPHAFVWPATPASAAAALAKADALLASLLAAHQQVTAERDEDRAEHARYRASAEEMWETAKRHGGRMLAEKRRADVAEAFLATANAEIAQLRDNVDALKADRDDAIRMLDVWFDTSTKTNEQVVPQLVDALVGYLRTCRCGGMPAETSDMIEAGAADFIRRRAGYIIAPVIEAMVAERTASLRAEGEDLRAYAKKVGTTLVRLTCDGSEFYTRAGEDFRVDADACDAWVRRSRQSKHDMIVRLTKEISALRAEGEAKDRALKPFADLASSWVVQTAAQRDELLTLSNGERMCGIKATAFIDADTELARAATAREGA